MPGGIDAIKPAGYAFAIAPSDSTDFAMETRAIYVGTGGNVACDMYDPVSNKLATVTFTGVVAGSVLPIQTKRIRTTNTTASTIIGLA